MSLNMLELFEVSPWEEVYCYYHKEYGVPVATKILTDPKENDEQQNDACKHD